MQKILVVAQREYLASVKTKAFIISLVLMPLMMGVALFAQRQLQKSVDASVYHIAIVDRTPGGTIGNAIAEAAARREKTERRDPKTGEVTGPGFEIEILPPAPVSDQTAVDRQRLELSDRARSKELLAFVEIGARVTDPSSVFTVGMNAATQMANDPDARNASPASLQQRAMAIFSDQPDELSVRYSTAQPTLLSFRSWLQQEIVQPVFAARLADATAKAGVNQIQATRIIAAASGIPILVDRGMAERAANGAIGYESNQANLLTNMLVPAVLVTLMLLAVLVGASPLSTNIVEEKQLRIAEVLLGGLRPFELMLGKLLGGAATSMTLATIYFAGIFIAAYQFGFLQYVRPETIAWFVLFTLIGVLMYGSLFVAAGAAVTNLKEAQTTLSPVMILIASPFFVLSTILQYPNGTLARCASFFPLTAPTAAIVRAAIPRGAPRWELCLSAGIAILGTVVIIWIAGRIFRAGMLLTSKPASLREAIGWIVRG